MGKSKRSDAPAEVYVDARHVLAMDPDSRAGWLTKACKQASEGEMNANQLYDVLLNRKLINGLSEKSGQKMWKTLQKHMYLFSERQQRCLSQSTLATQFMVSKGGKDFDSHGNPLPNQRRTSDEDAAARMEEMMARCRNFVREKASTFEERQREAQEQEEAAFKERVQRERAEHLALEWEQIELWHQPFAEAERESMIAEDERLHQRAREAEAAEKQAAERKEREEKERLRQEEQRRVDERRRARERWLAEEEDRRQKEEAEAREEERKADERRKAEERSQHRSMETVVDVLVPMQQAEMRRCAEEKQREHTRRRAEEDKRISEEKSRTDSKRRKDDDDRKEHEDRKRRRDSEAQSERDRGHHHDKDRRGDQGRLFREVQKRRRLQEEEERRKGEEERTGRVRLQEEEERRKGEEARTGWMAEGATCGTCSKKVLEQGGVICARRRPGGKVVGCGAQICWRCMNRAKMEEFGRIKTNKSEFLDLGVDAWWMHEACMKPEDEKAYFEGGKDASGPSDAPINMGEAESRGFRFAWE